MSLGINTTTPDGMVFAADSRQSYRNQKGMSRIGSDSASKVFKLGEKSGIIVTGLAFIPENNVFKNISHFIDDFIKTTSDINDLTIIKLSEKIKTYFEGKYQYKEQFNKISEQIKLDLENKKCKIIDTKIEQDCIKCKFNEPSGKPSEIVWAPEKLVFIVGGYNKDSSHQVYQLNIPGAIESRRDSLQKGHEYGAAWIGQSDVTSRIILGYDACLENLPMTQKSISEIGSEEVRKQLRGLEYMIN
ncbi:MAG: hypothetical protein V1709_10895 [Planctomycetota bacterium]